MFEGKERQDVMSAKEIRDALIKLIESEKGENEAGSEADASLLDDALSSVLKFIEAEEKEGEEATPVDNVPQPEKTGVVDTGVLTGPIGGLKNFLIQKQRDNTVQ